MPHRRASLTRTRTTTSNDFTIANGALDDHDGVVQTALDLFDELLCATTEQQRAGFGLRALSEDVVPLAADLSLFETAARAKVLAPYVRAGGLNGAANSLDYPLQVAGGDATSAEDVAVGKPGNLSSAFATQAGSAPA